MPPGRRGRGGRRLGLLALVDALGVTKASMAATVRSRLRRWSELLWDRAVARKVSENRLVLGEVIPEPAPERARVVSASRAVKDKIASHAGALAPTPGKRASI